MSTPIVTLLALGAIALALFVWRIMIVATGDVQLTMHEVPVRGLPRAFDGYRLAILSDFHHGPQQPTSRAQRAVAYANAQSPHLAILLGDYGTSEWWARDIWRRCYRRTFRQLGPVLAKLRARDGVVAVIGNHDYYASGEETHAWLESLGARVLRNDAMILPSPDGPLRIVGFDDLEEGELDATRSAELLEGDTPTIVLSHHPDGVQLCDHACVRLVLSGHTHGGQVVLPLVGAMVTRSMVCTRTQPAGWVENRIAPLFVSRGVGSQLPVRIGSAPEVALLTLRALHD